MPDSRPSSTVSSHPPTAVEEPAVDARVLIDGLDEFVRIVEATRGPVPFQEAWGRQKARLMKLMSVGSGSGDFAFPSPTFAGDGVNQFEPASEPPVVDKELRGESIPLDGRRFERCHFVSCELIFSGTAPTELADCAFEACTWSFDGPAAATIEFVRNLAAALGPDGEDLIRGTYSPQTQPAGVR